MKFGSKHPLSRVRSHTGQDVHSTACTHPSFLLLPASPPLDHHPHCSRERWAVAAADRHLRQRQAGAEEQLQQRSIAALVDDMVQGGEGDARAVLRQRSCEGASGQLFGMPALAALAPTSQHVPAATCVPWAALWPRGHVQGSAACAHQGRATAGTAAPTAGTSSAAASPSP